MFNGRQFRPCFLCLPAKLCTCTYRIANDNISPTCLKLAFTARIIDYLLNRFLTVATFHLRISRAVFGYTLMSPCICPRGRYSHTLPIRVCAAQRGRDFEAPDLEWDIHFRGVF